MPEEDVAVKLQDGGKQCYGEIGSSGGRRKVGVHL